MHRHYERIKYNKISQCIRNLTRNQLIANINVSFTIDNCLVFVPV